MKQKVVLIGASTGGPSQIKELLKEIRNLSSIVIIIQHMKEEVLPFFIKDILSTCRFNVHTTPLEFKMSTPQIIICSHSSVIEKKYSYFYIQTDRENQHYTPDINKFFQSFSSYSTLFDIDVIIMTGIGSDGIEGAKVLKDLGATIYAEDEVSSPVYGMPKAAVESGIVDREMSFQELKEYFREL